MNNLQIFENERFGKIRVVEIEGEPWFVGKDIAESLGYADAFGALKKHVDSEDKQNCQNSSFDSPRGMTVINESGVYCLVLQMNETFNAGLTAENLRPGRCSPCGVFKRGTCIRYTCEKCGAWWDKEYKEPDKPLLDRRKIQNGGSA